MQGDIEEFVERRGCRIPIVVHLHGVGVDIGLQVIIAIGQRRQSVHRRSAMLDAFQLQSESLISSCHWGGSVQQPAGAQ